MLADVMSTLLLTFFFTIFPMTDKVNNSIQIINELVVLVCTWLMFWFTTFVGDPMLRYDLAWKFMIFIGANIVLNVSILLFSILRKVYQACKIAYLRRVSKANMEKRVQQDSNKEESKMEFNVEEEKEMLGDTKARRRS